MVKILFKTLRKDVTFTVDLDENLTIRQVKEQIEATKGDEFPSNMTKLIFQGAVVKDEITLKALGAKEGDFMVCMKSKTTETSSTPAPTTVSAPAPTTVPAVTPAIPPTTVTPTPATTTTTTTPVAPAPMEASVRSLMEMGFPEAQVRAALRAAYGNADRAVEFLFSGIPAGAMGDPAPVTGAADPLAFLRSMPQLDNWRFRSQNGELPQVIQEIGSMNPEYLLIINRNQEAFTALMNERPQGFLDEEGGLEFDEEEGDFDAGGEGEVPDASQLARMIGSLNPTQVNALAAQMGMTPDQLQQMMRMSPEMLSQIIGGSMGGGSGGGDEGDWGGAGAYPAAGGGGGAATAALSAADNAAVDRLTSMGFARDRVVEAYLICDRNEQAAANYLFDNME